MKLRVIGNCRPRLVRACDVRAVIAEGVITALKYDVCGDGFKFTECTSLLASQDGKSVPVVSMRANSTEELELKAIAAGCAE